MASPLRRLVTYSLVGFTAEVAISAVHDLWRKKPVRFRTSPWMFPIYGLLLPLYEPLHNAIRGQNVIARGTVYGISILGVEYASGAALREVTGEIPWDYSDAAWNIHGLIRPDYFFQWAALGLALEPLHDRLTN